MSASEEQAAVKLAKNHAKLQQVRSREDLSLRPMKHLKDTFTDFEGTEKPLRIRYYQIQGIIHMIVMPKFVLGDDCGIGKCVEKTTAINTLKGLVEIQDLNPGITVPDTWVPIQDWEVVVNGQVFPIKNFYYGGVKPTFGITTRCGFSIEGSTIHPLLARASSGQEKWIKTKNLQIGDFLCVDRKENFFPEDPVLVHNYPHLNYRYHYNVPNRMNPDLARLVAYIVAEGWTNHDNKFGISQDGRKNPEVRSDIEKLLQEQLKYNKKWSSNDLYLQIGSKFLRAYLKDIGIDNTTSRFKQIPKMILQSSKESMRQFLRGFIDAEGSVSKIGVEISTSSEKLSKELQIMLLQFGIVSKRSPKTIKGYDHIYWRLAIMGQDVRLFSERIGLVSERKRSLLQKLTAKHPNPNLDVIPFTEELVGSLYEKIKEKLTISGGNDKKKGSGIKSLGYGFSIGMREVRRGVRDLSYQKLKELLEIAKSLGLDTGDDYATLRQIEGRHYFYDPVKEIVSGFKEVMDIEVDDPSHSFVGNGFVNHNTLQSIGALCFLWEKTPNQKVVVVTNKSAVSQWMGEFAKFTDGIQVVLCRGTPKKRQKVRDAFMEATGPIVLIMGYKTTVNDFEDMQEWEDLIWIFDECFAYHTPILLADGTTELIGKLVCQHQEVEVLSYNSSTGVVEPRRIVNFFKNPIKGGVGGNKILFSIDFRFGGTCRVTSTHKFFKPDQQEILARNLKVGTRVLTYSNNIPTNLQEQVVWGSLLGDACISHPNRPLPGISFVQSAQREQYLSLKRGLLSPLGVSEIDSSVTGYQPKDGTEKTPVLRFRLDGNPTIAGYLEEMGVWRDGKKRVTVELLDRIDKWGIAFWYADDGSLQTYTAKNGEVTHYVILNTQGFSHEEQELLAGWLRWKWGVAACIKKTKPRSDRSDYERRTYPYLYLPKEAAHRFLALLPKAFPGVGYKFPDKEMFSFDGVGVDLTPRTGLVVDTVKAKSKWVPPKNQKYVYNIEVEGNHNYFANKVLVLNCTAFKNPKTQTHQACKFLSAKAKRTWGLTATLIKNRLLEGFGIYEVIVPGLFRNKTSFLRTYCITEMQKIPGSRRKIPIVVGHERSQIELFKAKIDPFFLGRAKFEVASELPVLTTRNVRVDMNAAQKKKYKEALSGLLQVGRGNETEFKETDKLTEIIYCQEIVDHLELIECDGGSTKVGALFDLLKEEFADEKVIVFSRFARMIDILEVEAKKEKIKAVRISGSVSEKNRKKAQDAFQDPKSDVRVIFVTEAGKEALNLQAARVTIFYDTIWSAGDYIQILGRMIRIGSTHDRVYAIHLVARGSVDLRVLAAIKKKMVLIEATIGKRIKGEDDDNDIVETSNEISDIFTGLLKDAQEI